MWQLAHLCVCVCVSLGHYVALLSLPSFLKYSLPLDSMRALLTFHVSLLLRLLSEFSVLSRLLNVTPSQSPAQALLGHRAPTADAERTQVACPPSRSLHCLHWTTHHLVLGHLKVSVLKTEAVFPTNLVLCSLSLL